MQRIAGEEGLFRTYAWGLDAVRTSTDGALCMLASVVGCPASTAPVGYLEDSGRPFGLGFVAPPNREITLLRLMGAFEATFPRASSGLTQIVMC